MEDSSPYRDYTDDELIRILERQREEHQRFFESGDILDDIDHDDRHLGIKRPPVPDMRFEPQFRKSVAAMRENGATNAQIFFSTVIVNQFVMPFINGFSWSLLSHVWRWWRVRDATAAARPSSQSSFFRGLKHGISKWVRNVYDTFVHLPALTQEPAGFARTN